MHVREFRNYVSIRSMHMEKAAETRAVEEMVAASAAVRAVVT